MSALLLALLLSFLFLSFSIKLTSKPALALIDKRENKSKVIVASMDQEITQLGALVTGMAAGAFAGATVDIILAPIDTIKTRLQSKAGIKFSMSLLANIYKGIGPTIAASAPCAATFFGTYDYLQRVLSPKFKKDHQTLVHMTAACGGNLAQSVIRVPFEVIKQRLQAGVDSTVCAAISNVLKDQGIRGLYKGWGALAARDLPFDAIQFPIYEFMKGTLKKNFNRELYPWETSACGFLAGGFTAAVTTPLDVIKTRIMTNPAAYNNMVDCFAKIVSKEGVKALYAGVVPRVVMISTGGAIFFGALESARTVIRVNKWFDHLGE